ncbi:MAG: serine hydrolase domain-containing protein [bacterium]
MSLRCPILLLAFTYLFTTAIAQNATPVKLPDDFRGQRVAAFLKLVNSTDDATVRDFVTKEMAPNAEVPMEERVKRFQRLRANVGAASLRRVLDVASEEITILLETKKPEWLSVRLVFDPNSQNQIGGFDINAAEASAMQGPSAPAAPTKINEADLAQTLEKYLNDLVKADEFSGAVLVAKNGTPIFLKAYGLASKEFEVPNRVDTKFNLGSINKLFTTLAIAQLSDAGKVSFADPIKKYLPDYPNQQAAEKVTIKHLLMMSSGIGDIFGENYEGTAKGKLRTLKDFLPLFAAQPLAFEPGTRRQYSNGGFVVLGLIIEKASGQSYFDYVQENIYKVAGMESTGHYESDSAVPNLASGYSRHLGEGGMRRNNAFSRPFRGSSAGGGYSTVEDMLKFANAIESKKLAVPESLKASGPDIAGGGLASGIGVGGGAPGINAAFETKVAGAYTIVVMSNYDPPTAEKVARQLRGWLGAPVGDGPRRIIRAAP